MSQPTLAEQISAEPTRERVVAECVTLVDEEVKGKSGLGGVAIKTAYATVKAVKRGFTREVINALLDDWVVQLEPYYTAWSSSRATTFAEYVTARSEDVAEDLLKVTDARVERTRHKSAAKAYGKLRTGAKRHVAVAVPGLGKLVERHL